MKIPLSPPNLGKLEQEYVADAVASGWVGPDGPYVERFEEMVAKAADCRWAIATITGTAALEASASVMGFAGKKVEVPGLAFPAMRNVLRRLGCKIKVDEEWGANHDEAWYKAKDADWPEIHDCAPAIGERIDETATVACYSFAANKTITCGQGGAIVGNCGSLRYALRTAIHQGSYGSTYNFRMANVNAALGCAQMERLEELRKIKKRLWDRYEEAGLPLPMMERGRSRWRATLELPDLASKRGPIFNAVDKVMEYKAEADGISIPNGTTLTEAEQDIVIKTCLSIL